MIVIAWVRKDGTHFTGRYLGLYSERPEVVAVNQAHAVVWSRNDAEIAGAREHLAKLGDVEAAGVYMLPDGIDDPLAEAKRRIMLEVR